MRVLEIGKNDAGQRLDKFLTKAVRAMPPSLLYKSIRTKKIKVNRKRAEIGQILCEGDTVQLFLPEELFPESEDISSRLAHITPAFEIVYEDDNVILCDKPAGILVHSENEDDTGTLIVQIQAYLYQKGDYRPHEEQSFAPALCNRIDRNTGGIVIAAKNAAALRELNSLIKERKLTKKYLCAVHGSMEKSSDTLKGYLTKDHKTNTVTVTKKPYRGSKEILTRYRVLEEKDGLSLLDIDLLTGRTHQIRAHLSSVGHPLLGDGKYGINRDDKKEGYKFQALYSYSLTFNGGELLSYLNGRTFTVSPNRIYFLDRFHTRQLPSSRTRT
jgi:23S rRNA pseudouridine955/2504/2580 synthase